MRHHEAGVAELFRSVDGFRHGFEQGLIQLLATPGELGEDILVLANANFAPRLWAQLREDLRRRFAQLATAHAASQAAGLEAAGAADDRATLEQIFAHGFDTLAPTETRQAGPWELHFNPLRALRPARHSNAPVSGIRAPFEATRFHFAKPFLRREIFWQGDLLGREAALFYNKFPFADYHGLLVPDLAGQRPQFLETRDIAYFWQVGEQLARCLPGFGLGYNSYGAHASVNHLHFQTFLREHPLPLAAACWAHNGGEHPYPCRCERLDSVSAATRFITELHRRQISYQLIHCGGCGYCLPRRAQGEVSYAPWISALAWYEMAGGFPLTRRADFEQLSAEQITAQVAAVDLAAGVAPPQCREVSI